LRAAFFLNSIDPEEGEVPRPSFRARAVSAGVSTGPQTAWHTRTGVMLRRAAGDHTLPPSQNLPADHGAVLRAQCARSSQDPMWRCHIGRCWSSDANPVRL